MVSPGLVYQARVRLWDDMAAFVDLKWVGMPGIGSRGVLVLSLVLVKDMDIENRTWNREYRSYKLNLDQR